MCIACHGSHSFCWCVSPQQVARTQGDMSWKRSCSPTPSTSGFRAVRAASMRCGSTPGFLRVPMLERSTCWARLRLRTVLNSNIPSTAGYRRKECSLPTIRPGISSPTPCGGIMTTDVRTAWPRSTAVGGKLSGRLEVGSGTEWDSTGRTSGLTAWGGNSPGTYVSTSARGGARPFQAMSLSMLTDFALSNCPTQSQSYPQITDVAKSLRREVVIGLPLGITNDPFHFLQGIAGEREQQSVPCFTLLFSDENQIGILKRGARMFGGF